MSKIATCWVPHHLTGAQISYYNEDDAFISIIVALNETWAYEHELKRQFNVFKKSSSGTQ